MSSLNNKDNALPLSIELLFNNEKLDFMKTLSLLYAFSKGRKKHRPVSEILFYYSLVHFDLIKLFEPIVESRMGTKPSLNLYFRFQAKINKILLNMAHLQFVTLQGDVTKKLEGIKVSLTPKGKEFFEEIESEYFSDLVGVYISTLDKVKFSPGNEKILKGVQQ
ncbi:hypothetical protein [Pseudobacillus badius]|uniref:hypothetical protein n=1 Tax=Bacillus badius TaxID=1455 RepID=UPI0007B06B03|nr:hypothetical protein [Bacillus badius]KZN98581.1 hypothetical protein A4244_19630 [Bacillus badius]OCS83467.1 hypothetical protein A6M11_19645 [Bacillus badius]OVE46400.1 hypothetical protein B1A98_19575 [Bacillus badius]TDV97907.1 hypothetical protein B0G66_1332 [Bacillus badius]